MTEKRINEYYEVRLEFRKIQRDEESGNFISGADIGEGEPIIFESKNYEDARHFVKKVKEMA